MDKNLLLFVKDLRVFYILNKKLREKNINFGILEELTFLPHRDTVIVSDFRGLNEIQSVHDFSKVKHLYTLVNYDEFPTYDALIINLIRILNKIQVFSKLTCAIDPGTKIIGMAYFLDEKLLFTENVYDKEMVIDRMNMVALSLKMSRMTIKLGNGDLRSLGDLLRLILGYNQDHTLMVSTKIYLVSEFGSSKHKKPHYYFKEKIPRYGIPSEMTRHEKAAITIGIRDGDLLAKGDIEQIIKSEAKRSELRYIQDISRKSTNGKYSLSQELAEKVYSGEISMENALKIRNIKEIPSNDEEMDYYSEQSEDE
jgi:hypothetical protein